MEDRIIGRVKRVNGPVIEASDITDAMMMELVRVGAGRLVGEIVKLDGNTAVIQVYEDTTGIKPGDDIFGSGMPLSVELGPGLIGTIYDGIQRPLEELLEASGEFIEKGITRPALNREKTWHVTPSKEFKPGDDITEGIAVGTIQETDRVLHKILVPPGINGKLKSISPEGEYTIEQRVAEIETDTGLKTFNFFQRWPIRKPRPVKQ